MKHLLTGIVRTVPALLEQSSFQVCLNGWPAVAAIAVIGATIMATVSIVSGNQGTKSAD